MEHKTLYIVCKKIYNFELYIKNNCGEKIDDVKLEPKEHKIVHGIVFNDEHHETTIYAAKLSELILKFVDYAKTIYADPNTTIGFVHVMDDDSFKIDMEISHVYIEYHSKIPELKLDELENADKLIPEHCYLTLDDVKYEIDPGTTEMQLILRVHNMLKKRKRKEKSIDIYFDGINRYNNELRISYGTGCAIR